MSNDWRSVEVDWKGEQSFVGRNLAGGSVQMGAVDGNPGTSPMELLLIGLAGCTGMDVVSILTKKRKNVRAFKLLVKGCRAESDPRIYTEIFVEYMLWGEDLDSETVAQAIKLSEEKYCSVGAMLGKVAQLHSGFQINPET